MSKDRHIYLATAVVALAAGAAIDVLMPRDPLAGTIVHGDAAALSQPAPAIDSSRPVEASSRTPERRNVAL